MSTRIVKDAIDTATGELIYLKGHAAATYLSDGRTVEDAITNITSVDIFPCVKFVGQELTDEQKSQARENIGAYSKPLDGIPTTDLASEVQTSLSKANTALQSYTEQYTGTVTGVKINGETKNPSSGIVDLGYIHKQILTSSTGQSSLSVSILPNTYSIITSTSLSTLTITLGSVSNSNILNDYFVEFTTGSSGTTVSLPSTIKWANGETPTFEASTTYQISIVNNLGVVAKFK